MLFLTLDCGRRISLDAFDYDRTYAGLMEGRPDAEYNAELTERALTGREGTWGKRTVHLIPPAVDVSDPDHPTLPPVILRAWLICYEPIDKAYMGSELVVVWFAEECHSESIENIVCEAVRELPWDELACDFNW